MEKVTGYRIRYGVGGVALVTAQLASGAWTDAKQANAATITVLLALFETGEAFTDRQLKEVRMSRSTTRDFLEDDFNSEDFPA